ncbi:4-amino-4-deoxychorismate lyase [Marivirga lumbricoides]|uniref:branched-chain-amino-acid transaminase n=1 Tax=Marivirga lumbricoides TaxID=1046115 RepID=A0ABQ1MWJ0_9BACT|nr:4-amino-4-deoxychorismate lyase [Marivirga lumbricoides]
MMINYNGKFLNYNSNTIKFNNRGLNYGDGIFETIIYHNESLSLYPLHWQRLKESTAALKMKLPFTRDGLKELLLELIAKNELVKKRARLKVLVYRQEGGLYSPESTQSDFLISAIPQPKHQFKQFNKVYTSKSVQLQSSPLSPLKTISALPYVLAGIEKKEREAEELVLTDTSGNIAEASAANIIIYSAPDNKFSTPSLDCGGINGVSRRFLLQEMEKFNLNCEEVKFNVNKLNKDIALFTTNVAGVNQIMSVNGIELNGGEQAFYLLNNLFPFNH